MRYLFPQRGPEGVVGRAYPCPFGARAKRETARALWAYIADPGKAPIFLAIYRESCPLLLSKPWTTLKLFYLKILLV